MSEPDLYRSGRKRERAGRGSTHRGSVAPQADAIVGLRNTVDRLIQAAETVLASAMRAQLKSDAGAARLEEQIAEGRERSAALARNRGAQQVIEHRARALEAVAPLAPGVCADEWDASSWTRQLTSGLAAASYVRCGRLRLTAKRSAAINEDTEVPFIVPLLDRGNVLIRETGPPVPDVVKGIVQDLSLRALAGTAAGQLSVITFDPGLRGITAHLAQLRKANEELVPPALTEDDELETLLTELSNDVRRVTELYRGKPLTLGEFRRETSQPIETYQLVIFLDFPRGFDEQALASLASLMRAGPRCGISFLVHQTDEVKEDDWPAELPETTVIELGAQTMTFPLVAELVYEPDAPSLAHIDTVLSRLVDEAAQASVPQIEFGDLHTEDIWAHSSSKRITALLGRSGHEAVELTLGDEREQLHNVLVTGAVGQGKSNLLMVLVHSLAYRYSPNELEMYLLDLKDGMTLFPLAPSAHREGWLPHARVLGVESDREFSVAVLNHLVAEFERRSSVMKAYGDNIMRFRELQPNARMPRLLLVIDEFQTLFEESDDLAERALQQLERLARKGRAYGIHLLLASQALSGITALLAKQDGILAQFPIRLALKNSSSESRVVLDPQNTEAARLRFRGEAVVNKQFGATDGNRRAMIAYADPDALETLRRSLWLRSCEAIEVTPPLVFQGDRPSDTCGAIPELHALREASRHDVRTRLALLGREITVTNRPVGIPLGSDAGRHLAIIGAGESHGTAAGDRTGIPSPNLAVGALQAAALSLALQHPDGDATFVIVDLLPSDATAPAEMEAFARALQQLGSFVRTINLRDVNSYFASLREPPDDEDGHPSMATYVVAFALDRATGLRRQDETFAMPVDGLHTLLRVGPSRRQHLLAWWSHYRAYVDHLGIEAAGTIDGILALRIHQSDASDLFGPFVSWSPAPNRGLILDRAQSDEPQTIIPFGPISGPALNELLTEDWDPR